MARSVWGFGLILATLFAIVNPLGAQDINIYGPSLIPRVDLFLAPANGTFIEGTTFEIPVYLNTRGHSINAVELRLKFDPKRVQIVKPSSDKSIISLWLEPPAYSNERGTAKLNGAIPNGITVESGLIASVTFKAILPGETSIVIDPSSRVLANDGQGTDLLSNFGNGSYKIVPQPPAGVTVFSDTHPFSDQWYNNQNPIVSWKKDEGVNGFSFILDNKPATIPDNTIDTNETTTAFSDLSDGLWYFHIKAEKRGVWGNTTHFIIRIDSTPPAAFTPKAERLAALTIGPTLISFFTTDNLSGIDHYEVGVLEKSSNSSPLFVQTESPYQLPRNLNGDVRVIVRAVDHAGNVRDANLDIVIQSSLWKTLKANALEIALIASLLLLALIILHYLFGHHLIKHLRRAWQIVKQEERQELIAESQPPTTNPPPPPPPPSLPPTPPLT